jgi:hypothetical protein
VEVGTDVDRLLADPPDAVATGEGLDKSAVI